MGPGPQRDPRDVRRIEHLERADTQQILASVVRTARQRQLDPRALFTTMLCAPEPVVPEALALPPPA